MLSLKITFEEIQKATLKDRELYSVIKLIKKTDINVHLIKETQIVSVIIIL